MRPWSAAILCAVWVTNPVAHAQPTVTRHTENWLVPSLHATGLLAAQRVGAMILWQRAFSLEDGERNLRFLREGYTQPPVFDARRRFMEWDGDRWQINFVGHGLMGSEIYLRARQCGHGPWTSIALTAAASAIWEYGFEVWNAHPSANDLIWTPIGGALIGEMRLVVWEAAGGLSRSARAVVRALVDPFGELERALGTPC